MTVRIDNAGAVWTIIHSRPEHRNAMDPDSADALHGAFLDFERDEEARVAVLWGEGGYFCAGWDLKYAATLQDPAEFETEVTRKLASGMGGATAPRGPMGPTRLELMKPVIAAVEGPAVAGGMEVAMWCDVRIMGASAYFGVYCRRWGVPLVDGGTFRLPRLVGQGRAMEIILTGRKVPAEEALRIGLAELVVADGEARAAAEAMAAQIARFPQGAVRADRRSVYETAGLNTREALLREWANGAGVGLVEGVKGAARFASGKGRHGDFEAI